MNRRTVRNRFRERLASAGVPISSVNPNSRVLWEGTSELDGETEIVAIASGFNRASANEKTDDMIQVYFFLMNVSPIEAAKTGLDVGICGDCPLSFFNSKVCYVDLTKGTGNVWSTYKAGRVLPADECDLQFMHSMEVRLGAYGDPASVPYETVSNWIGKRWTGYTHQWESCDVRFKDIVHASVEDIDGYNLAKSNGWSCYRVMSKETDRVSTEVMCLNYTKDDVTCKECGLCCGNSTRAKRDIANVVHGIKYKISGFKKMQEAA